MSEILNETNEFIFTEESERYKAAYVNPSRSSEVESLVLGFANVDSEMIAAIKSNFMFAQHIQIGTEDGSVMGNYYPVRCIATAEKTTINEDQTSTTVFEMTFTNMVDTVAALKAEIKDLQEKNEELQQSQNDQDDAIMELAGLADSEEEA